MRDGELDGTRDREEEVDVLYSPIKAGRPVGQPGKFFYLLDKFRDKDTDLRTTGRKLSAHNPKQRSSESVLQVAASL